MEVVKQSQAKTVDHITLAQIAVGKPFRHPNGADIYMRIAIADEHYGQWPACDIWKGHSIAAVNLNNGCIYIYPMSKSVVPVDAKVLQGRDLLPSVYVDAGRPGYSGHDRRHQHRRFKQADRRH